MPDSKKKTKKTEYSPACSNNTSSPPGCWKMINKKVLHVWQWVTLNIKNTKVHCNVTWRYQCIILSIDAMYNASQCLAGIMCSSEKCSSLHHGRNFLQRPPPLWKFQLSFINFYACLWQQKIAQLTLIIDDHIMKINKINRSNIFRPSWFNNHIVLTWTKPHSVILLF